MLQTAPLPGGGCGAVVAVAFLNTAFVFYRIKRVNTGGGFGDGGGGVHRLLTLAFPVSPPEYGFS